MTDMPAFYPADLILEVEKRLAKGVKIHSLVLWTKHPASLLKDPLYTFLQKLKAQNVQLYVQLTITGMGKKVVGTDNQNRPLILEPNVPETSEALSSLKDVIALVETPERIKLRIDPIVRIQDYTGSKFSNISTFESIISDCAELNIVNYAFSFLENDAYNKVNNRFIKRGIAIYSPDHLERQQMQTYITSLAQKYKVSIKACCVPGFAESACIDALLLEKLNPLMPGISHKQPRSRAHCGCTVSTDIGGWPPKKCYSGCLYCYASPFLSSNNR